MVKSRLGKLLFMVLAISFIIMIMASYSDATDERDLLLLRREKALFEIAVRLDGAMGTSFQEILHRAQADVLDEDRQTEILNKALQPILIEFHAIYPEYGLGYYSRDLERNVATAPFNPLSLRKPALAASDFPYDTGSFKTVQIDKSLLWDGKPVIAVHHPLYREGKIIGHVFVNSKVEDIQHAFYSGLAIRIAKIFAIWLVSIGVIGVYFKRYRRSLALLIENIKNEHHDRSKLLEFPELLPVLQTAVALQEEFTKTFHINPNIMFIVTLQEEKYIDVNDSFAEVLGCSRNEVIGHTVEEFSLWTDYNARQAIKEQLLKEGQVRNHELHYYNHAKELRIGLVSADWIRLKEETGILYVITDVTEKRHFEVEIARYDRLNIVGEMAASVAHEIRNPMTTIQGFLQLVKKKSPQELMTYLDIVLEELNRANTIIDDFLALARNRHVEKTDCKLNDIIKRLYPLLYADCVKLGITISVELDSTLPAINCNKKEIDQLIINIVRNGLEAMSPGGILSIATMWADHAVKMQIRDTGCGIPDEIKSKLFDPFFTTKINGTGLGLPVCQSIIEKHGGTISIHSTAGVGTTFEISFPITTKTEQGQLFGDDFA